MEGRRRGAITDGCFEKGVFTRLQTKTRDNCDAFFIRPVESDVRKEIRSFLKANPDFLGRLNAYRIPPVGSLHHFHLASMPTEDERERLVQFVQKGRTFRQIRSHLKKTGLAVHLGQPIVGSLMLINNDLEIDMDSNRQLIYRDGPVRAQ